MKEPFSNHHRAAFLCDHVFNGSRPILYVCRDGGDWQFLCGDDHEEDDQPHLVGIVHVVSRDPSLEELADLSSDWEAEREMAGGVWKRRPMGGP